jgi:hypothetical protein
MSATHDDLIGRLNNGQMTRRSLLFSLPAIVIAPKLAAQCGKSPIQTLFLSNVMIAV